MAGKQSAGILLHRLHDGRIEFLLVHPGGPFWAKKDDGAWSIPKGEFVEPEDPLEAAKREFAEETGFAFAGEELVALTPVKQPGGKVVHAWMAAGDLDTSRLKSGVFTMEWPPKSGVTRQFPEVDRAVWFDADTARRKILAGQLALIDEAVHRLENRR